VEVDTNKYELVEDLGQALELADGEFKSPFSLGHGDGEDG
jgi:hypothetical protein